METDFQSLLIHKKEEFELVLDSEAVTLAKSIGNLMDQFLKNDVSSQRNFLNNFMRTRVRLDICVPHMRKKNIRAQGGKLF
ncbi:hypothetical protein Gotur_030844, partial [Gossypium turneri]